MELSAHFKVQYPLTY